MLAASFNSGCERACIWVTGAGGLIGHQLTQAAASRGARWRVHGLTRAELDLTDFAGVRGMFHREQPQCIVHCAALSRSPVCQNQPTLARKINVEATALLAELAANIPFIFFSSDLVFDGRQGNYDESAPVNPLSVYAETKVEAERIVMSNPRHTVVRTSLNGGISPAGNRAFNEEMRLAWQQGQTVKLFTDEYRCPIPAPVTARAIWELAAVDQPGLYHLAGRQRLSRWEIGQLLAARWPDLPARLEAGLLREYGGAPRPADCSLNCAKIQRRLSFPLPGLADWLAANPEEPF
jgi:dTDP-4-dehydrorhamnose reductase